MRHALGVSSRIADGHRSGCEECPQVDLEDAELVEDGLQVEDVRIESEVGLTIREAGASTVVVDYLSARREPLVQPPVLRVLPVELEVVERYPGQQHERGAAAALRPVGNADAVPRLRVLDARLHGGTHFTSGPITSRKPKPSAWFTHRSP